MREAYFDICALLTLVWSSLTHKVTWLSPARSDPIAKPVLNTTRCVTLPPDTWNTSIKWPQITSNKRKSRYFPFSIFTLVNVIMNSTSHIVAGWLGTLSKAQGTGPGLCVCGCDIELIAPAPTSWILSPGWKLGVIIRCQSSAHTK